MEEFARIEVQKGRINEDYALIYREFLPLPKDTVSARALAGVLFTHKIFCENRKIRRVVVCHPALKHEMVYPVSDRTAYIRVYGQDARIFLEDEKETVCDDDSLRGSAASGGRGAGAGLRSF